MHSTPPAAPNSALSSRQLRRASSEGSRKIPRAGQTHPGGGLRAGPTGTWTARPFPSLGVQSPSSSAGYPGTSRAAAPSGLGPLHLVDSEPGPALRHLPAPSGGPQPGPPEAPARPCRRHPVRFPSRTRPPPSRQRERGSRSPSPRPLKPDAPPVRRPLTSGRTYDTKEGFGALVPPPPPTAPFPSIPPPSEAATRGNRGGCSGSRSGGGHQHRRLGLRPSPGPRRPRHRPHPAPPQTPLAPPRPAGPAHSP